MIIGTRSINADQSRLIERNWSALIGIGMKSTILSGINQPLFALGIWLRESCDYAEIYKGHCISYINRMHCALRMTRQLGGPLLTFRYPEYSACHSTWIALSFYYFPTIYLEVQLISYYVTFLTCLDLMETTLLFTHLSFNGYLHFQISWFRFRFFQSSVIV